MAYKRNWLSRHGKKWTPKDMLALVVMYEEGTRWGNIALVLQRSIPSCVDRLRAVRFYQKHKTLFNVKSETYNVDKMEIKGRK